MAILIFVLSLVLLIAAGASGYQSLDLLPTSLGVLYALAAAGAACAAAVVFAIAVLIRRIDTLTKLMRQSPPEITLATAPPEEVVLSPPATGAGVSGRGDEAVAAEDESPININRAGHLPSLETEVETSEPEPQGPPSLIGSYSSAGANYKIFTDGSIEAETDEGTFKFASMSDFKRHLLETKRDREVGA